MVFAYYSKNENDYKYSCKAFTSHTVDRGSIPCGNIPESLKQVVTAPMPNDRQQVRLARPSEMTVEPRHSRFGKLKKPSLLLNGYMSSDCRSTFEAYHRYWWSTSPYEWKTIEWDVKPQTNKKTFSGSRFLLYYALYSMHWPYSVISCLFSGLSHYNVKKHL